MGPAATCLVRLFEGQLPRETLTDALSIIQSNTHPVKGGAPGAFFVAESELLQEVIRLALIVRGRLLQVRCHRVYYAADLDLTRSRAFPGPISYASFRESNFISRDQRLLGNCC